MCRAAPASRTTGHSTPLAIGSGRIERDNVTMDGVSAEDGAERVFEETDQTMRKLIAAAQRLERLPSWFQPEGNFDPRTEPFTDASPDIHHQSTWWTDDLIRDMSTMLD